MEIWKDIPWYEWYEVSNLWKVYSNKHNKFRKLQTDKEWYLYLTLCKEWKQKSFFVHRLVLLSFIWENKEKNQANHKNWIKNDNRLENLEWCTASENQKHKFKVLWYKHKEWFNSFKNRINWYQKWLSKKVKAISDDWKTFTFYSMKDASEFTGENISIISRLCNWKQIKKWTFNWEFIK